MNAHQAAEADALLVAAVRAKVQRFLPSEFGSDTLNPKAATLPVFAGKIQTQRKVEELAARGKLSYTYVITGPFLDMMLEMGFTGLDLRKKQVTYLDGGDVKFSSSTRATIGKAVVSILSKPEETKNRAIYVQDVALSLKDLLRLSKKAMGEDGWTEIDGGSSEDVANASLEKLRNGQKDMGVFLGILLRAVYGPGYGGVFPKVDNELLGISGLQNGDVVELVRETNKVQTT